MLNVRMCMAFAFAVFIGPDWRPEHHIRAAPQILVFCGPPLEHCIVLGDLRENARFMNALVIGDVRGDTVRRVAIEVAGFYQRSRVWTGRPVDSIPFALADMRARYYPAQGRRPALLIPQLSLGSGYMKAATVGALGLLILEHHGIPASSLRDP